MTLNESNQNCIFCKIIKKEIPCFKIYEDNDILAFLDIRPYNEGHTVVIPKCHIDNYYDLNEEWYSKLNNSLKIIQKILKDKLNCKRVCQLIEGFEVPHTHIHLIPANSHDDFNNLKPNDTDMDELKKVHKKIVQILE